MLRERLCQPSKCDHEDSSNPGQSQPSHTTFKELGIATAMCRCEARNSPLTYVLSMLSCRIPMASLDVISWESTTMPGGSSASELCRLSYRLKLAHA